MQLVPDTERHTKNTLTSLKHIHQPTMLLRNGFCGKLESLCCSFFSLFPKVFVLATLTWAVWGTISELHFFVEFSSGSFVLSALIICLYILCIYTYAMIIWKGPGTPMDFPELKQNSAVASLRPEMTHNDSSSSEQSKNIPSTTQRAPPLELLHSHTIENGVPCLRWCAKCEVWKPDRCHHCSNCNSCFLRMDHHCPWFSCCIGFRNHKFFIQFLIYALFLCLEVFAISFYLLWDFLASEQYTASKYLSLNLVFLALLSLVFTICLFFFAGFLIYLVLKNQTTIEFQDVRWNYLGDRSAEYEYDNRGKKKRLTNFYDLGKAKNWQAIMGASWIQWLLPLTVTSRSLAGWNNGLNFEVDEDIYEKYCHNLQLQERLNEQLQDYRDQLRGQRYQE